MLTTAAAERIPDKTGLSARTRLALQVHLRLARCRNLMMKEMRRSVERWNLTLPQFDVLAELARAPEQGFTFAELSRLLLVTSGNLTGIIDRLEAEGLVRRVPEPADRRVTRMMLTSRGKNLMDTIVPQHADDVAQMLSIVPKNRLEELNDLLGLLRDGLHARERPGSSRQGA